MFRNFLFAKTIQMGGIKAHFWNAVPNLILDGFDQKSRNFFYETYFRFGKTRFLKIFEIVWKKLTAVGWIWKQSMIAI